MPVQLLKHIINVIIGRLNVVVKPLKGFHFNMEHAIYVDMQLKTGTCKGVYGIHTPNNHMLYHTLPIDLAHITLCTVIMHYSIM